MTKKRICLVSSYPMSLLRGGLDIQAERTLEELARHDDTYHYEFFDWRTHQPADAYHFFGAPPHLWEIMLSVRAAGKPYLVHLLSGSRQNAFDAWVRDRIKRLLGYQSNSQILKAASLVAMITDIDRRLLSKAFGIPATKTAVVPNFVDEAFFDATPEVWQRRYGSKPFLLCVGIIQARKNQLLLAQTANAAQLPLVLIGQPMPGEGAYADQVEDAMRQNASLGGFWIKGLPQEDPLLLSAHHACRAVVLLSKAETQPLSILQAMAAQRPVLLGKSFYAQAEPFAGLPQVSLDNSDAICTALKQVWSNGKVLPLSDIHRTPNVVRALVAMYGRVLSP